MIKHQFKNTNMFYVNFPTEIIFDFKYLQLFSGFSYICYYVTRYQSLLFRLPQAELARNIELR